MARILYENKVNPKGNHRYIEWIPFNEFGNIEYLAKGGFGEVHKAIWIDYDEFNKDVVLKRIYNSGNKIMDILNEVKRKKEKLILILISLLLLLIINIIIIIFLVKSE